MRKIALYFSAVIVLISINTAHSQEINFGAKGSYLLNTFTDDDGMNELLSGYSAGAFVQYKLNDQLGVRLEPAFAVKGAEAIDPLYIYESGSTLLTHYFLDGTSVEYTNHSVTTQSIEIPLLATFRTQAGGLGLQFSIGPVWDVLLSAKNTKTREATIGGENLGKITSTDDVTDRFGYNDIGAQIGVGIGLPIDPLDIAVELRYRHGFNDINNVEGKPNLTTNSFGVHVLIGLDGLVF